MELLPLGWGRDCSLAAPRLSRSDIGGGRRHIALDRYQEPLSYQSEPGDDCGQFDPGEDPESWCLAVDARFDHTIL